MTEEVQTAPPSQREKPPLSRIPESIAVPSVLHPRGLISPPLPDSAPWWRRFWRALWRLGEGLYYHDAFQAAPAMAFHFFLSLLPLFVFLGYLLGSIAQKNGIEAVLWPVFDNLPEAAASVVKKEVERMAGASTLGPIAAVGFLWIASGGTHGLMDALEIAVGAPRRPWWKKRMLAGLWVIGSLLAMTVGSLGVVEWDALIHTPVATVPVPKSAATASQTPHPTFIVPSSGDSANLEGDATSPIPEPAVVPKPSTPNTAAAARRRKLLRSGGERLLALGVSGVFTVLALAGFYWFSVSHPRRVRRRVVPGAMLAVALGLVISWGFGIYIRSLTNYAVFYGSLAAVAVLLVWLWLASLAILVGAELNSQLEGLRD